MKTLYVDCSKGITKNSFLGALLSLYGDKDIINRINRCLPENYTLSAHTDNNGKIKATLSRDGDTHGHHHGSSLEEVKQIISNSAFSNAAKTDAAGIFDILGIAEAAVHNVPVGTMHFHEVGCGLSVYYTLCLAAATELTVADKIIFSPVNTGCGKIVCSHGELDIPAPAAATILAEVPHFCDCTAGELCTPSGAAIAKYYAAEFTSVSDYIRASAVRRGVGLGYGGNAVSVFSDY